jgi:hypothetical protein
MSFSPWYILATTIILAVLGAIAALFQRLRNMESATASLSTTLAQLSVKAEPGWASILEQAKLNALHKPEVKYEHRDLLIKHRLAGSSTPEENAELFALFTQVITDPETSPIDRINASAAVIAMKANDEDKDARLALAALPPLPIPVPIPPSPTPARSSGPAPSDL